jgi:soluble lytic murein transglycosylase
VKAAVTLVPENDPEKGFKSLLDAYKAGNYQLALVIAGQVAEQQPGTAWYRRSLFIVEQVLIRMDLPPQAGAAMLRVKAEYPEMADYAVLALADYHFAKSRFTQAAALYQDLTEHYPKSSLAARAAFQRGQALLGCSAFAPAGEALENFLRDYPRSESAPDAWLGLGRALVAEARPNEAVRIYRDIWVSYPESPAEQEALKALAGLAASGVAVEDWSGSEWFERGRNLFRTSQYEKAAEAFGKLLEKSPDSPNRAEAVFRIGVSRFYTGRRADAAAMLEKFIKDNPRDQRIAEALYWIGKSYSKLGEREKAIKTFQKLLESYGDSDWADDALFLSGNIYREANDMKKGLLFYRRLVSLYPESKFADSAIWWNAWAYYRAGEYGNAERTLQELINAYPRSFLVSQARYWQGRIAEKTGNNAKASAYYARVLKQAPYTYYGYRAAERIANVGNANETMQAEDSGETADDSCGDGPGEEAGCRQDQLFPADLDDGPPVWTEETKQLLAAEPSFKKTLELVHLDMKKEAAADLWYLQDRLPRKRGTLIGLSKAFFELGDYYRSLILVLRNYERYLEGGRPQVPADLWQLAYPQGYWDSIVAYSRKYGQDPYFIAAIIREESQFREEALSPAGARGVMQVMPATGEWIASAIRLQRFDKTRLFESDTAINLGTWYIGHLMKRFKNDPLLAAAAYNAGPAAVAGWIGSNGTGASREEFVESIPFSETRGYVKKVLRNYAEYKRIYGKPAAAPVLVNQQGTTEPLIADHEQ